MPIFRPYHPLGHRKKRRPAFRYIMNPPEEHGHGSAHPPHDGTDHENKHEPRHKTIQYTVMQMLENSIPQSHTNMPASTPSRVGVMEDETNKNRPTSKEGNEANANYNMDLDPTVAKECTGVVGQPCRKPTEATVSIVNRETAKKNRRIISSNIRRKKLIVWIVLFAIVLVWNGFADMILRLYEEDGQTFSMDIIKPWLGPVLIIEFGLTALGILFMIIKMRFMRDACLSTVYRILTGLNSVQYLMAMIALPFGIFFFFTEVSTEMKKSLAGTVGINVESRWRATQFERQCCGFHNRHDWEPMANINLVEYVHDENDEEEKNEQNKEVIYPPSCCNMTAVKMLGLQCSETSKLAWDKGCHDAEFFVILDYVVCFVGLMLASFVLNVVARISIDKVERYLTIYRPYEMF